MTAHDADVSYLRRAEARAGVLRTVTSKRGKPVHGTPLQWFPAATRQIIFGMVDDGLLTMEKKTLPPRTPGGPALTITYVNVAR